MIDVDILIIGAGPAGMAAAAKAAELGASVALLDEQAGPGGQIYRSIQTNDDRQISILGKDYAAGRPLAAALTQDNIEYEPDVTVWRVDKDGTVTFSKNGAAMQAKGRHVILATGALERPMPIPGWTLPGVITAGAAQILLKSSKMVATDAVLAGSGPLLYLVASQMIAAGTPPKALVETQSFTNYIKALRHIGGAIRGWQAIIKGFGLIKDIKAAGVQRYQAARNISVNGDTCARSVRFVTGGKLEEIACANVLLHQGVVPNTQITRSLDIEHKWNPVQRCFQPITDPWGATENTIFSVAGDGAGVGGAKAAEYAGHITACNAVMVVGLIDRASRQRHAASLISRLIRERAVRSFLDILFAPPDEILRPADETIICRCEEVTAGDIRSYIKIGCVGPNQTKAFGRCGMGPCQGRYCGSTVTEILAHENTSTHDEVGSYRIRSPLKPVTLGEVGSLADSIDK